MRLPKLFALPLALTTLLVLPLPGWAEDWPTGMHDNQRSGVTTEEVRPPLAVRWELRAPFPPAPGWDLLPNGYGARKNKPDVSHDDAFRVIAAGDAVYFCSSAENCLYALDAATGAVRWTHFADAAPRLAPVFWKGKLFFGADDGVFRCLDAATGKLLWQVKAALTGELMLGYGRFSSLWPIRAGGIVEDGVAYFSAGLFPSYHIFLYAVKAEDGSLVWRRQVDADSGDEHVPQGLMLARDDSLFTTSRTAPARWSKSDGSRMDFATPFPQVKEAHEYSFYNGGSDARIWNGRNIVYGSGCILAYDPDQAFKDSYGRPHKGGLLFNWFNARQAVFNANLAFLSTDDHVLAVEPAKLPEMAAAECKEFEETYKKLGVPARLDCMEEYAQAVKEHGAEYFRARYLANGPLKWGQAQWDKWPAAAEAIFEKMKKKCAWMTPCANATEALILSGNVLYAGGEGAVSAFDASTGAKLWSCETGSRVRGLVAAHGRLFVSTIDGTVRCYAPADPSRAREQAVPLSDGRGSERGLAKNASHWADVARDVLKEAAVTRGYCLILGHGADELAEELARASELTVYCLLKEEAEVTSARQWLARARLYGGRVVVTQLDPAMKQLPFAPYLFNVVLDCPRLVGDLATISDEEIVRVTKPCGGVAFLSESMEAQPLPESWGAESRKKGHRLVLKRGRVPGTQDWTHNYATPANTYCSEDSRVRGPFGVLWYGRPGPRQRIERHASPPMPLVVNGILFTLGYDLVMAYDVYNGVCCWERELEGATREHLPLNTSNLAADESSLFVVCSARRCLRLDAHTGATLKTYEPPKTGNVEAYWAWVAREGAFLYGSRAETEERRKAPREQTSNAVFALDVATGQQAWVREGQGIDHDGIAIGGGHVFFVDRALTEDERKEALANTVVDKSVPDRKPDEGKGRGGVPDLRKIVALDAQTGKASWEKPFNCTDITLDDNIIAEGRVGVACMYKDGVLVVHGTGSLGHPHKEFLAGQFARRALYAFGAGSGKLLWGGRKGYMKRPIIVGARIYAEPFAWELKTGKQVAWPNPLSGREQVLDFHRGYIGCGHHLASECTLFGARRGIAYWNLEEQTGWVPFGGMALACGLCAVPADGVFAAPEGRSGCACDTAIHTSIVFCPIIVPGGTYKGGILYGGTAAGGWGTSFTGGLAETLSLPVKHVAINLGAPGYRYDPVGKEGTLWIPYPARVDSGPLGKWLPTYQHDQSMCYCDELLHIEGTQTPWVFTSGCLSEKPLRFRLIDAGGAPAKYTIKLYFAEPANAKVGDRVFSVSLQGKNVLSAFDIVAEAGGPRRALVKDFHGVEVKDFLEIVMKVSGTSPLKQPLLCGFEALREDQ
ncbi:MAG: PQQ-binding-like beta-propeller repeat protein [Planctomycetota bacterium]